MHQSRANIQLQGIEAEVCIARKHGSPHLPDVTKWPITEIRNIPRDMNRGHLLASEFVQRKFWESTGALAFFPLFVTFCIGTVKCLHTYLPFYFLEWFLYVSKYFLLHNTRNLYN
jgi:hypothetical protein